MSDFNFTTASGTNEFRFGLEGQFLNLNISNLFDEVSYDFNFGEGVAFYSVLYGSTNNFNSIWCDPDSSLSNGKFYTSTNDAISIVNLTSNKVEDFYTTTNGGQAKEPLISDDIVDINISG